MNKREQESNQQADETAAQADSAAEQNGQQPGGDTTPKNDAEGGEGTDKETVTLSKKEVEDLRKKAQDYEGMIRKKRLEKLHRRQEKTVRQDGAGEGTDQNGDDSQNQEADEERIKKLVDERVEERLRESKKEDFEKGLDGAYAKFIAENPWADDDDTLASIGQQLRTDGATDEAVLYAKLNEAALRVYPQRMQESMEARVRVKVEAEKRSIDAGSAGAGGGSTAQPGAGDTQISKEDQAIADRFFDGDINRYLKYKQKA